MSQFYVGSVDNSLSGYQYVDEQTNETYTMTFGNENTLFRSLVKTERHQNFTWGTTNGGLFPLLSKSRFLPNITAGTMNFPNVGFISKSFESNIVTDFDFNNWTTDNNLGDWTKSGSVKKVSITYTTPKFIKRFSAYFL